MSFKTLLVHLDASARREEPFATDMRAEISEDELRALIALRPCP